MDGILCHLTTALLPVWPPLAPDARAAVGRHCAAFVRMQFGRAPAHIRFGLAGLLLAFRLFALFRLGPLPLAWCSPGRREAALVAFSNLGPAALAALERALRSMALLAYFEHSAVLAALGEGPACLEASEVRPDPTTLVWP